MQSRGEYFGDVLWMLEIIWIRICQCDYSRTIARSPTGFVNTNSTEGSATSFNLVVFFGTPPTQAIFASIETKISHHQFNTLTERTKCVELMMPFKITLEWKVGDQDRSAIYD